VRTPLTAAGGDVLTDESRSLSSFSSRMAAWWAGSSDRDRTHRHFRSTVISSCRPSIRSSRAPGLALLFRRPEGSLFARTSTVTLSCSRRPESERSSMAKRLVNSSGQTSRELPKPVQRRIMPFRKGGYSPGVLASEGWDPLPEPPAGGTGEATLAHGSPGVSERPGGT